MALYAIGDLHLSLANDKPMDVFGDKWKDHAEKLKQGFSGLTERDLTVLCGDLSWAMDLDEALTDFRYIDALPGKKILLKGNHDYWWSTATKAKKLFQANGLESLDILNNNCFFYGDYALCGTRFTRRKKAASMTRRSCDGRSCAWRPRLTRQGIVKSWSFSIIRPSTVAMNARRSWDCWKSIMSASAVTAICMAKAAPPPSTAGELVRSLNCSVLITWISPR